MTLIDFGDFKLRFDPKEVRINIDGDLIDIGARKNDEEFAENVLAGSLPTYDVYEDMQRLGISDYKTFLKLKSNGNSK